MEQQPPSAADSTGADPDAKPAPRRPNARLVGLALAIAVVGYGLDQLTKWIVQSSMQLGETIDVLPPLLRWHYILNPGAAFSIGTSVTWVFTIVQAAVVLFVLYKLRHLGSRWWAVALGGLLGGAAGNLTDRLFREPSFGMGHVVDFIALPNFAVFNIADSLVVCSMVGICLLIFRGIGVDGRKEQDRT